MLLSTIKKVKHFELIDFYVSKRVLMKDSYARMFYFLFWTGSLMILNVNFITMYSDFYLLFFKVNKVSEVYFKASKIFQLIFCKTITHVNYVHYCCYDIIFLQERFNSAIVLISYERTIFLIFFINILILINRLLAEIFEH